MTQQRHMVALRDGMINVVPVILVGSTFLLLGSQWDVIKKYGSPALQAAAWVVQYHTVVAPKLLLAYRLTMGMLGLYVAFSIAICLAREYELPVLPQGLGAAATFLLTAVPFQESTAGWVLPMTPLGAGGLFMAILIGLLFVEISRRLMPKPRPQAEHSQIPAAVSQAFGSFLPMLVAVAIVWILRDFLGVDLQQGLEHAMEPLARLGDSLGCVVLVNLVMHVLGITGVHGISVINAVFFALWQKFLLANTDAHNAGQPLPYVTAYPFWQWFIWLGGQGATLPVAVQLLMAKSEHARRIGRMAIVPSLFNVNEPLLFGLPVVANPVFLIPFVAAPVVCGSVAFLALQAGWVARPFIEVPWVLPCFLGAPLATQDGRAFVLLLVNLALAFLIWLPFVRAYDQRLLSKETS
ncbi:MAG: PTS sugar transporter subunit IIC [Candidatus Xenobia bacterium]